VVKLGEEWEVVLTMCVESEVERSKWVQNLKWPFLKIENSGQSG
jgi:hypothetical protein